MAQTRLSYGELLTDVIRCGILPTGIVGRPTTFGFEPRVYCTTDEAVIVSVARLLASQGFEVILSETAIIEPNFYSILLARQIDEGDDRSESEAFELRLVREGGNPLALALVGSLGNEAFRYGGNEVVYYRDSVLAKHLSSRFVREYPRHTWRWMPIFSDDFILS